MRTDGSLDIAGVKKWAERAHAGSVRAVLWQRPKALGKFEGGTYRTKASPAGVDTTCVATARLLRWEALHTWAGLHLAGLVQWPHQGELHASSCRKVIKIQRNMPGDEGGPRMALKR